MPAALLLTRRKKRQALSWLTIGILAGAVSGGLAFTLIENTRWYGAPLLPFAEGGGDANRNASLLEAATSVGRFTLSLFDLGLITRPLWPGRGGWGSTFGLPLVWALAVLALRWRNSHDARVALTMTFGYFLLFAFVYADADIAHRLVLAPGLLVIVTATYLLESGPFARPLRYALVPVLLLSAAQITRSAFLYLMRA
jgi:hypothetical protein